jgi:hypothetical protein
LISSEAGTINYAAKVEEINGLILDLYKWQVRGESVWIFWLQTMTV